MSAKIRFKNFLNNFISKIILNLKKEIKNNKNKLRKYKPALKKGKMKQNKHYNSWRDLNG